MNNEEIAVKLAEHEQEIKVANHRIKDLEEQNSTLQDLALSVKELAVNMHSMLKEQERQAKHIEVLEAKPAKRWETVVTVIITAICSGLITLALTNIFK